MRRRQRGSSVLYVVVLSPVLLLLIAFAVQLAALQLQRARLHSAVDEAVVVAASRAAVVTPEVTGLDPGTAAGVARQSLADNLLPLADQLDGTTPEAVAAAADVALVTVLPARDPFDAATMLTRPTLEIRARIPVHAGLLALAGLPSTVTLTMTAGADLRVSGGTRP